MTDISDLFWQASLQDIKQGYIYQQHSDEFICLICGKSFTGGIVYPGDGQLYEARKYIKVHIDQCHRSAFHFLINLDKKLTGLTDHQKTILELFYEGSSDNEVAKALGTGSTSTIRNHRFSLRERQKQAKVFLAIMELLGERLP
ncbi:MAG: helix-turn-helix transcriptional regulator, partial [Desulfocucumaceae bacterium]